MKLIFEKLMPGSEEGFTFKEIRSRSFSCPWHFHTENELILTLHCPGYRMVGDDLTELEAGDLVLLGSNLPHIWQRDGGRLGQPAPAKGRSAASSACTRAGRSPPSSTN